MKEQGENCASTSIGKKLFRHTGAYPSKRPFESGKKDRGKKGSAYSFHEKRDRQGKIIWKSKKVGEKKTQLQARVEPFSGGARARKKRSAFNIQPEMMEWEKKNNFLPRKSVTRSGKKKIKGRLRKKKNACRGGNFTGKG